MKSHKHVSSCDQVGSVKPEPVIYCSSSQKKLNQGGKIMSFQQCVRGFSESANLPRPVPVQRYRKGSHPGSHHRAGHRDLQTGVPHRHGSGAGDREKSRPVHVFIGQKHAKHYDIRTGSR